MSAFAKAQEGIPSDQSVFQSYIDYLDVRSPQEIVELYQIIGHAAPCHNHTELYMIGSRENPARSSEETLRQLKRVGFAIQDRYDRRGVNDHLAGKAVLVVANDLVRRSLVVGRTVRLECELQFA